MTLDEVIKVLRQHNEKGTSVLRITRGQALEKDLLSQVLDSCEQLISERAEYKRLLKAAVEDFKVIGKALDANCDILINCEECPLQSGHYNCRSWNHLDEALALIGEDTNVPASADDTNVGSKTGSWISCKERLPEPGTMVIVASYGSDIVIPEDGETVEECCERLKQECVRVTLGFIGSDGWYGSDYFPLIVTPSFWQPLPEPPKDGERE